MSKEKNNVDAFNHGINLAAGIADDWTDPNHVRLHAGEMTAQEMRTVIAVAKAIAAGIREEKLGHE